MHRRQLIVGTLTSAIAHQTSADAAPLQSFPLRNTNLASPPNLEEITIAQLTELIATRQLSAVEIAAWYEERIAAIDQSGPTLRSVLEINPDARQIAADADRALAATDPLGPLHGLPIVLKDNIGTADRMQTTAGSLALLDARPPRDAGVVRRLRKAGATVFGKANLSEWANFRSYASSAGWSARGGQCRNPYAPEMSPGGSSSGSAAAVAANLAVAALGTETDGSIVLPAATCGIVGLKPTVGLTSRAGVIPIAFSQDSVGPMARTVADVAALLGVIVGVDHRDPGTAHARGRYPRDYTQFLDPNGLRGARIGVPRQGLFGIDPAADAVTEAALATMSDLGAEIIDPADIPTVWELLEIGPEVRSYEFKAGINAYLADLPESPVRTLDDLIAFNEAHADEELAFFGQEKFYDAQPRGPLTDEFYLDALAYNQRLSREEGIDAARSAYDLDAFIAPANIPAWSLDRGGDPANLRSTTPAALAGYPIITVPAGMSEGRPLGIALFGGAFSEPTLLRLAYAFEQATRARKAPQL